MNYVCFCGRVCKEPDIRYGGETCIAKYTIAIDRKWDREKTDFIQCTSFNKVAEIIEKHVHKGTKLLVSGELQNNNFEKDGKLIYRDQIIIRDIEFCESKKAEQNAEATDNTGFNSVDDSVTEGDLPFV